MQPARRPRGDAEDDRAKLARTDPPREAAPLDGGVVGVGAVQGEAPVARRARRAGRAAAAAAAAAVVVGAAAAAAAAVGAAAARLQVGVQ